MSALYYLLNGYDNPKMKNVNIVSLPKDIQSELDRMIQSTGRSVAASTLDQIN